MKKIIIALLAISTIASAEHIEDKMQFEGNMWDGGYENVIFVQGSKMTCKNNVAYYESGGSGNESYTLTYNPITKEPYYCKVIKKEELKEASYRDSDKEYIIAVELRYVYEK